MNDGVFTKKFLAFHYKLFVIPVTFLPFLLVGVHQCPVVVSGFLYDDESVLDSANQEQICFFRSIKNCWNPFQVRKLFSWIETLNIVCRSIRITFGFITGRNRYVTPEQVPTQYGGLSVDFCECNPEFTVDDPATEITIKPATKQIVEIIVNEVC